MPRSRWPALGSESISGLCPNPTGSDPTTSWKATTGTARRSSPTYRPAAPEEDLSAYFADRLDLTRVDDKTPFPLRSERWWVRTIDPDEDWEETALTPFD
jgi:hypothetical protein